MTVLQNILVFDFSRIGSGGAHGVPARDAFHLPRPDDHLDSLRPLSLTTLPHEGLALILGLCAPPDIRRFQQASLLLFPFATSTNLGIQVCRRFRQLMDTDHYLRHILELDICGYVFLLVPRQDLSYAEKVHALREHRNRWHSAQLDPVFTEFSPEHWRFRHLSCFVDGTYAYVITIAHPWALAVRKLHTKICSYQPPSFIKGTSYKQWSHDISGYNIKGFFIQPEQDLLVLLEHVSSEELLNVQEASYYERYRLHLRTMSTNEPHPAALPCASSAFDFGLTSNGAPRRRFTLNIFGKLVGLMIYSPVVTGVPSVFVVWDWVAGLTLAVRCTKSHVDCANHLIH